MSAACEDTLSAFVAGLLYRAALDAQYYGRLKGLHRMVYPMGQEDAFKTLLRVIGYSS